MTISMCLFTDFLSCSIFLSVCGFSTVSSIFSVFAILFVSVLGVHHPVAVWDLGHVHVTVHFSDFTVCCLGSDPHTSEVSPGVHKLS